MAYNTRGAKIVDPRLAGSFPKNRIHFVHIGILDESFGLLAVNQSKTSVNPLPYRISSCPVSPKGERRKKQEKGYKSHSSMVIH